MFSGSARGSGRGPEPRQRRTTQRYPTLDPTAFEALVPATMHPDHATATAALPARLLRTGGGGTPRPRAREEETVRRASWIRVSGVPGPVMIVAAETPLPSSRQSASAEAIGFIRPVSATCGLPQESSLPGTLHPSLAYRVKVRG